MPTESRRSRPLQRNPHRRRLGGVCAGIADYTGFDLTLVRFLFVLSFFMTGSLTFLLYLALWFLLPEASETPMPDVSWDLQRQLKKIDKKLGKLHKKHPPRVADLAQEAFEAIKLLAPGFEKRTAAGSNALAEAALLRFPRLLDQITALPAGTYSGWSERAGHTPGNLLLQQLEALRAEFQEAALAGIEADLRATYGGRREPGSAELEAFREQLRPLAARLKDTAGAATAQTLDAIEDKLGFLLERTGESQELLDLRPFEVRKIAFEYLPDALNQYLQLPPSLAQTQALGSGKTAEESLNEQLQLLDNTLQELAKSLFEKDASGLLVHGRFLKEKFAEQPFRLEER